MRSCTGALAFAAAIVVIAVTAADAQTRKRVVVQRSYYAPPTVAVHRDESGRTRTRLIVQPRSYLDGGTEVLPGQRKYSDYAFPPYYSPTDSLGSLYNQDRQPLNTRWELGAPRY
jgi:hypothetical protein